MNIGELCVIQYFENEGYEVIINNPIKEKGLPDFKVFNFNTGEKFYVEEKTDRAILSLEQENKIISLIKSGQKVVLAKFDSENYTLKLFELDANLSQKYIKTIKIKYKPREIYNFICKKCDYEWKGRIKKPLACPKCKSYKWDEKK